MDTHVDLSYHPTVSKVDYETESANWNFPITGIMGQDLVHPYTK